MTSQAKIIVLELADLLKNLKLRFKIPDLSICRAKYDALYIDAMKRKKMCINNQPIRLYLLYSYSSYLQGVNCVALD